MLSKKLIFATSICLFLYSCEPELQFTEPQPVNTKNLNLFPSSIQGKYVDTSNSTQLLITGKMIIKSIDGKEKIHKNKLDSTSFIIGNNLVDSMNHTSFPITLIGDSLLIDFHYKDTIFNINEENILRKMKSAYYLSIKGHEQAWSIMKLSTSGDLLFVSKIIRHENQLIEEAPIISETPAEPPMETTDSTLHYTNNEQPISMTKKEFRKFVRHDGFNRSEVYCRVE